MDIVYTQCILCRKGCRRRHCIAAMRGDDLLVRLETTFMYISDEHNLVTTERSTYAPPELSDPAITSIRLGRLAIVVIVSGRDAQ